MQEKLRRYKSAAIFYAGEPPVWIGHISLISGLFLGNQPGQNNKEIIPLHSFLKIKKLYHRGIDMETVRDISGAAIAGFNCTIEELKFKLFFWRFTPHLSFIPTEIEQYGVVLFEWHCY